jgi:3-methyladenine DNA glycosylase AlkC
VATRLKDQYFQQPFLDHLASEIRKQDPEFDRVRFQALVHDEAWEQRELKARMRHVSECLGRTLPQDYRKALAIIMAIEGRFENFDHLTFADFVERFGVDDFDVSLKALETLTRTSAEFAVRPFIRKDAERAMARMRAWSEHPSERVRRLSSEGCRPRLPWGEALENLKRDPSLILPILENLKDDPSELVRRSVANNLGDIAKDHPDLAVEIGERWIAESPARTAWVKHALRDLLKKGNRRALRLFGVGGSASVEIETVAVAPKRVRLGGTATLHIVLHSTRKAGQPLRLEYAMTYARPGGRTGRKVFKISDVTLASGASLDLSRKLSFADRSIRTHYPGPHTATLIVNGKECGSARFQLV